jgi:hypothetical protein
MREREGGRERGRFVVPVFLCVMVLFAALAYVLTGTLGVGCRVWGVGFRV